MKPFVPFLAFVCCFAAVSLRAAEMRTWTSGKFKAEAGYMPAGSPETGGIVDLALIYQGGVHRIDWTKEQFGPYLTWSNPKTQKEEWLFDGFLFIEFKSNTGHMYAKGYGAKPSTKADQLWYLDRVFEKEKSVHALDSALGEVIGRLGPPPLPRRVVLTLPEPIVATENWGELDGKPLDFKKTEDRLAAVTWFMERLTKRWNESNFNHLELAGFYWVAESMGPDDQELMNLIGTEIRKRGKRFYWIPYWGARGNGQWRELGFDVAYQQPNFFFKLEVPESRIPTACQFAKEHGMGMEMEWDERLMSRTEEYAPKMQGYLDGFEEAGVWATAAAAHYMAGHGIINLSKSKDPVVAGFYQRLCTILAQRQKMFAMRVH